MGAIVNAPIVLDVGKAKRKDIKNLEKGCGKIVVDVQDAVTEVTSSLGDQAEGKQFVPVVLVYRKKRRRNKKGNGLLPALF
jgi:hypothetical protein